MSAEAGSGRPGSRKVDGFTLIEIIVALLVLEVMMLGAVGLLRLGIARAGAAERSERVTWEVLALADSLRRGGDAAAGGSGASERPWGTLRWDGRLVEAVDVRDQLLLRVEVGVTVPLPTPPSNPEAP